MATQNINQYLVCFSSASESEAVFFGRQKELYKVPFKNPKGLKSGSLYKLTIIQNFSLEDGYGENGIIHIVKPVSHIKIEKCREYFDRYTDVCPIELLKETKTREKGTLSFSNYDKSWYVKGQNFSEHLESWKWDIDGFEDDEEVVFETIKSPNSLSKRVLKKDGVCFLD